MGGRGGGTRMLAVAIGVVAAIAIPIAAPAIAGAILGSTAVTTAFLATSAAAGAVMGAGAGALAGSLTGDAGRGALLGGAGGAVGGFGGAGGFTEVGNALFGPATPAAPSVAAPSIAGLSPEAAMAALPAAPTYASTGAVELASVAAPSIAGMSPEAAMASLPAAPVEASTGIASGATTLAPGATTTVAGGGGGGAAGTTTAAGGAAAPQGTQFERFLGGVTGAGTKMDLTTAEGVGRAISPVFSPSGIAGVGQLAMTMFNKPPESLTPQERSYVSETAELAGTNRALFEQRVNAARRLLQQGTPNPEEAYAQASIGVQRRLREAGLRDPSDVRRGLIEGARLGAAAIPGEYTRAASLTQAGLSAMPSTAPQGAEGMALPVYRDLERRQREYQADIGRGLGTLASAFGGRSKGGLFGYGS